MSRSARVGTSLAIVVLLAALPAVAGGGDCWSTDFSTGPNGPVFTLVEHDGLLYVGGQFTQAGSVAASNIAVYDGTAWGALGDGIGGTGFFHAVEAVAARPPVGSPGRRRWSTGSGTANPATSAAIDAASVKNGDCPH